MDLALIDRYPRHALWAAAIECLVFLAVFFYALLPPSLGSHVVLPGALMVLAFAGLLWITLNRPWDLEWQYAGASTPFHRHWWFWDPLFLGGVTLGLARCYLVAFAWGKEQVTVLRDVASGPVDFLESTRAQEFHAAWHADTLGALMVQGPQSVATAIMPLVLDGRGQVKVFPSAGPSPATCRSASLGGSLWWRAAPGSLGAWRPAWRSRSPRSPPQPTVPSSSRG